MPEGTPRGCIVPVFPSDERRHRKARSLLCEEPVPHLPTMAEPSKFTPVASEFVEPGRVPRLEMPAGVHRNARVGDVPRPTAVCPSPLTAET
jgi:hypothetical protein